MHYKFNHFMIKAIFGNIYHQINGGYTLLTSTTKLVDLADCFKSPKSPKLNMFTNHA